ncbi:MAG: oxidoreductase [Proteobacteria bacterium]|nr:MAG: oxidoreductase [Pseudomonadota bacterium]
MLEKKGDNGLVQINGRGVDNGSSGGISRRKFLQVLGAGGIATGLTACADDAKQTIFPYVKGEVEKIPGVAVWYSSTCTECAAGCGLLVRTREGRAVKVEGNPDHPVNKGGLCALGQSALQNLYDPDRVRQPLKRGKDAKGNINFTPVTWEEVYTEIATALADGQAGKAMITGELSGTLSDLVEDFCSGSGCEHVTFDALSQSNLAKAAEITFGTYGIPTYDISKAEVLVNFGADFLETFVAPVQYAKGWARARKGSKPLRVVHIEPRLSLTGASSDLWMCARPGSEIKIALAILKDLLEAGRGEHLSEDVLAELRRLTKNIDVGDVASECKVTSEKILLAAHYLKNAKNSLVMGGGASSAASNQLELLVVVNFLNLVLGNVGSTVILSNPRKPKSSLTKLTKLIESMQQGSIKMLLISGTNPHFNLPGDLGFEYALKKVPLVVSLSNQIDETARIAKYILPLHTGLESWGDSIPYEGVYSLIQPSMTPLYDTRHLGDILLQCAEMAGKSIAGAEKGQDFRAYLQASWKKLHAEHRAGGDFDRFWKGSLERGGYFEGASSELVKVKVDRSVFQRKFESASFHYKGEKGKTLALLTYPSIKTFDGRAANRPWLQELPDPITQVVWDSWAEIHPATAKKLGLAQGDVATLRNHYGEINVPVYLTEYVHKDVVAVPWGQGHSAYGRYATKVAGANVSSLLSAEIHNGSENILNTSSKVRVLRGRGRSALVNMQGSDSQLKRSLARTAFIGEDGKLSHDPARKKEHHYEEHHKQMYDQREHPLHHWGMAVDLSACTGCSACVVACYAENNIPVVGKEKCSQGREMSWLRIERYHDGSAEELQVSFLPMMCQQCGNAPCEPVCPVYATYHNEEGLNAMIYNRCVGTRYCSNNCSYKVRRFNWFEYDLPEPLNWQLNPDVVKRSAGVMEKCTFCVQRIIEVKDQAKDLGREIKDGEIKPACVQSCPTDALVFGDLKDPHSKVSKLAEDKRAYKVLDYYINTQPAVTYLERVRYKT